MDDIPERLEAVFRRVANNQQPWHEARNPDYTIRLHGDDFGNWFVVMWDPPDASKPFVFELVNTKDGWEWLGMTVGSTLAVLKKLVYRAENARDWLDLRVSR